jgi:hypothetical protein
METVELTDLQPITLDFDKRRPSFDSGLDFLVNKKTKKGSGGSDIDLGELDKLEDELNELSNIRTEPADTKPKTVSGFSGLFNFGGNSSNNENIKIDIDDITDSKLGHATMDSIGNTKTWDGFTKINEVPLSSGFRPSSNMSERDKRRKKRAMIKKLEEWGNKGTIQYNSGFNMESNYDEVEDEYEGAMEDKRRKDAVKISQNWLITMVNTIEYGNAFFDPFGISLDGWGESISEDIDSYNEIFEQLHEKYKGGKMSPELSLLLRLGFSASVVHFSNKALSSATPGFNDVIKQSPELMRMFTNATVDSMKQSSPGMAFASELLNQTRPTSMSGPPPPAVETRNQAPPPVSARPGMQFTQHPGNRPDINASRGAMFQEQGVDMNSRGMPVSQGYSQAPPPMSVKQEPQPRSTIRPEMTGPKNIGIDNIDSILSGLKTKNVDIRQNTEEDSMISVSSLRDIQNTNLPKKSRKNRSDKNIVSLDI